MLLHDNNRMMLSAKIVVDDHTLDAGKTAGTFKPSSIRRRKQDALLSFHHRVSFQSKLNNEQQHVQIGISLIQFVILPLLPKKLANDEKTVLGWYCDVFGGFKKRKDFVEALMGMCIAFPTVQAVNLLLPKITEWLKQPAAFISQVRRYVQSKRMSTEQFARECDRLINEAFLKSSLFHGNRNSNKNHLIMKRRVCSLKLSFEKSNYIGKDIEEPKSVPTKRHHHATNVEPKLGKPKRRKIISHCAPFASADSEASATKAIAIQRSESTTCPLSVSAALSHLPSLASLISPLKPTTPPRVSIVTPTKSTPKIVPVSVTPLPRPVPLADPLRWSTFRLANLDDLQQYRLELVVERPTLLHVLQCGPMEFYSIRDLRHHDHQFVVDKSCSIAEPTTSLTITKQDTCFESDEITVRRPGDQCFDEAFEGVGLPIERIVKWIHSSGVVDKMRDADATSAERVEMGVGGQAPGITETGAYAPDKLCGEKLFTHDDDGIFMRSALGRIYDGIQRASDQTQRNLEKPLSFWHAKRFDKYAKKLRSLLYATDMRMEWLSIQLKHISSLRGGSRHKDENNDDLEGYNKTHALCAFYVDALGDLWSIKFLANARGRIGRNHSATKKTPLLKVSMDSYLHSIDAAYQKYMEDYTGSYFPMSPLTARDSSSFFLDRSCPWTTIKIGNRVSSRCLCLPTTPKREYWLSAAVHWLERMDLTPDQMIEMLFVAGYQNNFHFFHAIAEEMSQRCFKPTDHPSEFYYERSMELFGNFVGGPHPRYSPPGVDYKKSFLMVKKRLKSVVACLRDLLEWFNVQHVKEKVPMRVVKERLQACHRELATIGKAEYAEFRLQIFVQMAALSGVVLKARPLLADFAYPVKGMASYAHLHETGQVEECNFEQAMEQLKHELQMPNAGKNEIETTLCESTPGRFLQKSDVFFFGQDLYRLTKEGMVECKRWSTVAWIVLPY